MAAALGPARSRELEAPGHSPAQPSPAQPLGPAQSTAKRTLSVAGGGGARLGDRGARAESRGLFGLRPPPLSPPSPSGAARIPPPRRAFPVCSPRIGLVGNTRMEGLWPPSGTRPPWSSRQISSLLISVPDCGFFF
ncbi:uncharacterized protein LOC127551731 [Antechinus flavipes]|uniref:uncharacterized protein LOC127551731 n=1 Tax=Antechinus flavipes TaxID=38775 RepID=UPI0022354CD1|nr:uncharacterized protein LOC127551731 [Antechinus flavipes]